MTLSMYYTIYKTTNLVNGKIYIGCHKTNDLNDGYLGSGKLFKKALSKYGVDNFIKEYIHICDTSEAMFSKEREIVNSDFIANAANYNLKIGGSGGFDFINENRLNTFSRDIDCAKKGRSKCDIILEERYGRDWKRELATLANIAAQSPQAKEKRKSTRLARGIHSDNSMLISPLAMERKAATFVAIEHQKGDKNSQYGIIWITNGTENKKIKKEDQLPVGWRTGRAQKPAT